MSAIDWSRITERRAHELVWALEIGGLPYRLVSETLPAKALPKLAGSYTDIIAITDLSPAGGTIPLLGGRGESKTATITLAVPSGSTLMGLLNRGCPDDVAQARVTTYIEHSNLPGTPATIELDRDPAAAYGSFPRALHIGHEAIWCTSGAGTAVGGGDPYRVVVNTRAVYGTQPQQQNGAEAPIAVRPFLLDGMVAWRGQRAILYVGVRLGSGAVSDLQPYLRGILAGPAVWADEAVATLSIVPLAAKLDQELIGPMRAVGLMPGWCVVDGERAFRVEHAQRVRSGGLWRSATDAASAAGAGTLLTARGGALLDAHNDFTLDPGHPRYGAVEVGSLLSNRRYEHLGVVAGGITINGQLDAQVPASQPVDSADAIELKRAELAAPGDGATLLRWPSDYVDLVNDSWTVADRDGVDGAWASLRLGIDARGPHVMVELTQPYPRAVDVIFWSDGDEWLTSMAGEEIAQQWTADGPERRATAAELAHLPFSFADPSDGRYPAPAGASDAERSARPGWWRRVSVTQATQRIECRGPVPLAPYTGGRFFYTDGPLRVPGVGVLPIVIDYYDRGTGQRAKHRCRIISSAVEGNGYLNEIHASDVSAMPYFADWPDVAEPVTIRPELVTDPLPVGLAILQLLLSGAGERINHPAYDVLPFGLNLAAADVDIPSFLAITAEPPFDRQAIVLQGDETAYDAIDEMLKSINAVLTTDLRGRLTIQQLHAISPYHARGTVQRPLQGRRPRTGWRDEVYNRLSVKLNHDDNGFGAPRGTIEATHVASLAFYGAGELFEIETRGARLPGLTAAEGEDMASAMIARIGTVAGFHRREWTPSYGLDEAILLALGGVYLCTDPAVLDYGATEPGVTGVPVCLVGLQIDAHRGRADATFIRFPFEGSGINAGARIVEVIDAVTVEVDPSAYVPSVHPVTGADFTAAEAFPAGSVIRLMPAQDWSAAVQRTVDSIDVGTQQITLTAAHGFAVGAFDGRIRPAAYGAAAGLHLQLAWIGDGAAPAITWV